MMDNFENNGIYGYGNSKRKKIKDELLGGVAPDAELNLMTDAERSRMSDSMAATADYLSAEQQRWSSPFDAKQREREYINSAVDYLVPEDNELRRRRNFVMADNIAREAAGDLYDSSIKSLFEKERAATDAKAFDEYKRYASVPGADALTSLGAMRRVADPANVIERTMSNVDGNKLDSVASAYANYARLSPEAYRRTILEPHLKQRMMDEYIDEAKPKNSASYIARSAWDNSLIGKATNLGLNGYSQTNTQDKIERAALQAYGANRVENLAAGIGSLMVDAPAFAGLSSLSSKAVSNMLPALSKSVGKTLLKKYAPMGMAGKEAERIARGAIVGNMSDKILRSSLTQGLTLGGYDAANNLTEDLLLNDGIDVGKIADGFAHGFGTGVALGVIGTPLKVATRGLTGGKKLAASAGVLSAESAVFTASSNYDKLFSGADIEPVDLLCDFGESAATLAAMRLTHWRPKRAAEKLDARGRLRPELRLTNAEARDIALTGINPDIFIKELETSLKNSERLLPSESEAVKNKYLKLLGSDDVATSTRLKLMYIVEDKLADTAPLAVDYKVEKNASGGSKVSLYDSFGRRIKTEEFKDEHETTSFLLRERSGVRRNKIAHLEEVLLGKYDTENFFRQAGRLSAETGVGVDEISEAVYKKINNNPLSGREQNIVKELAQRTSYGDTEVGLMLSDIRRTLERDFNLREGSLLAAVNRQSYRCSPDENRALDRYVEIMQNEAKALEGGTSAEQRARLAQMRNGSPYDGMSNDDIKSAELKDFRIKTAGNYNDFLNKGAMPDMYEGDGDGYIRVPKTWNKPYAWSYLGVRNTVEDMDRYRARAEEIANRMGFGLQYLYDENSLPRTGSAADYNNRVRALGWLDGESGKVYINLPNISNMAELEKTIVHEVVGHGGLNHLFGEYLYDFYDDVYSLADDKVRNDIHNTKRRYGLGGGYEAVEEYLSNLAEKNNPTPKERTLLRRFKDYMKNILVRNGILTGKNAKLTEEDFRTLLEKHHEAMMNRVNPDNYRARVFADFPSARYKRNYYSIEDYQKRLQKRLGEEDVLGNTADFLFSDKKKIYGDFIDDYKKQRRKKSYRFIGEKGAQNLANGKLGECYDRLNEAKALEKQQADQQTIWQRTGWERGADGEWRMEIPDHQLRVRDCLYYRLDAFAPQIAERYRTLAEKKPWERTAQEMKELSRIIKESESLTNHLKVKDVIVDNALYDAYPELMNIPVKYVSGMSELCNYDAKTQTLYIKKGAGIFPEQLQREIVKPVQQMIQHYEGFAHTISMYKADTERLFRDEYDEAIRDYAIINKMVAENRNPALSGRLINDFKNKYGRTPAEFKHDFPSFEEFVVNRIYGDKYALSGNAEVDNVYRRNNMSSYMQRDYSMSETEEPGRANILPAKSVSELKKHLTGPLDIIYSNLKDMYDFKPIEKGHGRKKGLSPDDISYFDKAEMRSPRFTLSSPYDNESENISNKKYFDLGKTYYDEMERANDFERLENVEYDSDNNVVFPGLEFKDKAEAAKFTKDYHKLIQEIEDNLNGKSGDFKIDKDVDVKIKDILHKNKRHRYSADEKLFEELAEITDKHFDKDGNPVETSDESIDWDAINRRLDDTQLVKDLKEIGERMQREKAKRAQEIDFERFENVEYDSDNNVVFPGLEFKDKAEAAKFTKDYHKLIKEIEDNLNGKSGNVKIDKEVDAKIKDILHRNKRHRYSADEEFFKELAEITGKYFDKDGNPVETSDESIDWDAINRRLDDTQLVKDLKEIGERMQREKAKRAQEEESEYDGYEDFLNNEHSLSIPGYKFENKAEADEYRKTLREIKNEVKNYRREEMEDAAFARNVDELLNDKDVQEIQRLLDRHYDKNGNEIDVPDDNIDWTEMYKKLESKKSMKNILKYLKKLGEDMPDKDK